MTKNITVTDENGIITGSTYPKRALGLVKKGRARWINPDTVCLCARDETEENTMANNLYEVFDNQISKMQEQLRDVPAETAMPARIKILETMETFRAQEQGTKILDMVKEQLDFIKRDLEKTADIDYASLTNAGIGMEREKTKQRMLDVTETLINSTMSCKNTEPVKTEVSPVTENISEGTEKPTDTNSPFYEQ